MYFVFPGTNELKLSMDTVKELIQEQMNIGKKEEQLPIRVTGIEVTGYRSSLTITFTTDREDKADKEAE